jgi:hypothetical protein
MNLEQAKERIAQLEETVSQLLDEKGQLQRELLNAKDPTPIKRVSFDRVRRLAQSRCLSLRKIYREWSIQLSDGVAFGGHKAIGFEVSLGHLKRTFKRLKDLWDFLTQESWSLGDLFPPEEEKKPKVKAKKQATCKYCQSPIQWIQDLFAGKWFPYSPDGKRHQCQHKRELVPF